MPALVLLLGALGLNYSRHRAGKSTICSTTRRYVGPNEMVAGWALLTVWFLRHYCGPFARAALEAFDDNRPEIEETP